MHEWETTNSVSVVVVVVWLAKQISPRKNWTERPVKRKQGFFSGLTRTSPPFVFTVGWMVPTLSTHTHRVQLVSSSSTCPINRAHPPFSFIINLCVFSVFIHQPRKVVHQPIVVADPVWPVLNSRPAVVVLHCVPFHRGALTKMSQLN